MDNGQLAPSTTLLSSKTRGTPLFPPTSLESRADYEAGPNKRWFIGFEPRQQKTLHHPNHTNTSPQTLHWYLAQILGKLWLTFSSFSRLLISAFFGEGLWAVCMQGSVTSLCSRQTSNNTMQCNKGVQDKAYHAMQHGSAREGRPGTIEQLRPCLGSRFGTGRRKKEWKDISSFDISLLTMKISNWLDVPPPHQWLGRCSAVQLKVSIIASVGVLVLTTVSVRNKYVCMVVCI